MKTKVNARSLRHKRCSSTDLGSGDHRKSSGSLVTAGTASGPLEMAIFTLVERFNNACNCGGDSFLHLFDDMNGASSSPGATTEEKEDETKVHEDDISKSERKPPPTP